MKPLLIIKKKLHRGHFGKSILLFLVLTCLISVSCGTVPADISGTGSTDSSDSFMENTSRTEDSREISEEPDISDYETEQSMSASEDTSEISEDTVSDDYSDDLSNTDASADESEGEISDEPDPTDSSSADSDPEDPVSDDTSSEDPVSEDPEPIDPTPVDPQPEIDPYRKEFAGSMPKLIINTENKQEVVTRDTYISCSISATNCDAEFKFDDVKAGIRVRGNASSNYGDVDWIRQHKVHYRIKFETKQNILGLNDNAKCKSWVLLRGDGSYVRDVTPFYLFKHLSDGKYYSSDYTYVRVILNGNDLGAYILCEQNQINKHRVNVDKQKEGETYLNTGYLMELENYPGGEPYLFYINYGGHPLTDPYGITRTPRTAAVSVKNDSMTNEQLQFLSQRVNLIYEICYQAIVNSIYFKISDTGVLIQNHDAHSAKECIEKYVALDAFVWTYIMEEFAIELDVGVGSFFFCIDFSIDEPKLTFCAPWDYSWAFISSYGFNTRRLGVGAWQTKTFIDYAGDRSNPWFVLFYQTDWFREEVSKEWKRMRDEEMFEGMFDEFSRLSEAYREDFLYTEKRWGEGNQENGSKSLMQWMTERISFLDDLWINGMELPGLPEARKNIASKATYEVHDFFRFGSKGYSYDPNGDIVYGEDGNDLTNGRFGDAGNFHDSEWIGLNTSHPNAKENGQYILFKFDQAYKIDTIYISTSNLCSAGIHAPDSFSVYWSNDGENWSKDCLSGEYTAGLAKGSSAEFAVKANKTAKYWKILINYSEGGGWCFLDEIQFVPAE